MKRYEFRAQKVLRVRRLQEDLARAGVAAARRQEQDARDAVSASQEYYAQLRHDSEHSSAASFMAARERASYRATAVAVTQRHQQSAEDATAQALAAWHDAHRKVDGLERLEERRREEYAVEFGRDQDATVDEMVVARARRSS